MYIFMDVESVIVLFFFFKQKTAYEMRISDWSSDVCSSDLATTIIQILAGVGGLFLDIFFQKSALDRKTTNATKAIAQRSEERRAGKECVSTCRYRWSQYN